MSRFVLVTYDIKDDRRRAKVANELKNYGTRVQYSVFECLPDKKRLEKMYENILKLIDEKEDSVRYYEICEACLDKVEIQGLGEISEDGEMWIV